jgi:preprotein translocase subunit SecF
MTLTTIGALAALLVSYISPVLSQIASVLIIGLVMDMIFTWLQNSVMLRWYCEKKGIGS